MSCSPERRAGGRIAAFTFISPVMQTVSGIDKDLIGALLLVFGVAGVAGVAGVIGSFVAGAAAERNIRKTIITMSILLGAVLALFPITGGTPITGVTLLILWGLAFGGVPVAVQTCDHPSRPGQPRHDNVIPALALQSYAGIWSCHDRV